MQPDIQWTGKGGRVIGPAPFLICGIVNVTPDSFYDGGWHSTAEDAVLHGRKLARQHADILDVGGESTRPSADPVSVEQELIRVIPVVKALAEETGLPISIDTTKAHVADAALRAGAVIVNDVSACRADPGLKDVLVEHQPGYVLMHAKGSPKDMQVDPQYEDVVDEVFKFFEEHLTCLIQAGLAEDRIVLDPGIGFGKKLEHNLGLLRNIKRFKVLGRPIFLGLSNKSMFEHLLGLKINERQNATQVATALMAERGVGIHRVHDVLQTRQTLDLVLALNRTAV